MGRLIRPWYLPAALGLLGLIGPRPLVAQSATLDVCNRGTVAVEVVVASRLVAHVFQHFWFVTGTPIAPGECAQVYEARKAAYPAYLAFGFADSRGQWGGGTIAQVPNIGEYVYRSAADLFGGHPILSRRQATLCVHQDATWYRVDNPDSPTPQSSCGDLRFAKDEVGHGPYVPVDAVLYFEPQEPPGCVYSELPGVSDCYDSSYYLGIAPTGDSRELHPTRLTAPEVAARRKGPNPVVATSHPAGAIPSALGSGTRNAMFLGRRIVSWNEGDDRRWFYDNGSPVEEAYQLTGVAASPLFDDQRRPGATLNSADSTRLVPLSVGLAREVTKYRGGELTELGQSYSANDEALPFRLCIVRDYRASPGRAHWCANFSELDLSRAEVADSRVRIPCRRDATCVIFAWSGAVGEPSAAVSLWGRTLRASLSTALSIWTPDLESGRTVASLLTELGNILAKVLEPSPVTSVP